ncbi:hypothetical protein ACIOKD_04470 [Streptomyces sp. NPDC087844]|uniref:hypothetical protein n=1 Tax=Streptomyces sp. NPDC087844 TaxID=3365805 RepID=UPI0038106B26
MGGIPPIAYGVTGRVGPFPEGVGDAARPVVKAAVQYVEYVEYVEYVDDVQPVVDGVGGSATTLAYGVTGDIRPFAYGVAEVADEVGKIAPFAAGTAGRTGSVESAAVPLAANAVGGVTDVAAYVTPSCLPPVRGGSAHGG